jgi:hypothetical protein
MASLASKAWSMLLKVVTDSLDLLFRTSDIIVFVVIDFLIPTTFN